MVIISFLFKAPPPQCAELIPRTILRLLLRLCDPEREVHGENRHCRGGSDDRGGEVHGNDRAQQEHDRQPAGIDDEAEHVAYRHALDVIFCDGALHKRGVQQSGEQSPDRAAENTQGNLHD